MYFPLFIDLTDRPCLIVGTGSVATHKREILESFGARVTMSDAFASEQVEGQTLVVAATDDRALNADVSAVCRSRGIPVNVVDDPSLCTFIFPSIFKKDPVVVAVSSGGACPVATQVVRDRVAASVSDRFVAKVAELGAARERIKAEHPDIDERGAWMRKELESC